MSDDQNLRDPPEFTRRQAVASTGGLLTGVGAFRAIDNIFLGYGETGNGTNLLEQDLAAVVTENLVIDYDERIGDHRVRVVEDTLVVGTEQERHLPLDADERGTAAELDADLELGGRLEALYADVRAVRAGEFRFAFSQPGAFFDRVRTAGARPDVVAALRPRGDRTVEPDVIERFAGVDPRRPEALTDAMVGAFREHASYDFTRYAAGSIEDNVIFGAADLRQHFEHDVSYDALLSGDPETGLFCWEFAVRSMEALEAATPWVQRTPVATAYVRDARHKHAYTGVASAVREDGDLVVPMTFVDYTHSTLYHDLHATELLGRGLAAYDDRHRATHVYW